MSWPFAKGYKLVDVSTGVGLALHTFYVKEHLDNKDPSSKGKIIFVGNIDYCKTRSFEEINSMLRDLFGVFGEVEAISVSEFRHASDSSSGKALLTHSTRFAHVTFKKNSDVKSIMAASYDTLFQAGLEFATKYGLSGDGSGSNSVLGKRGSAELFDAMRSGVGSYQSTLEIREHVNNYLKDFEEREEIEQQERAKRAALADDDGFIQVKHR